jgi:hypothetical protein
VGQPELPHLPLAGDERWEASFLSTKPHYTLSLPLVVSFVGMTELLIRKTQILIPINIFEAQKYPKIRAS